MFSADGEPAVSSAVIQQDMGGVVTVPRYPAVFHRDVGAAGIIVGEIGVGLHRGHALQIKQTVVDILPYDQQFGIETHIQRHALVVLSRDVVASGNESILKAGYSILLMILVSLLMLEISSSHSNIFNIGFILFNCILFFII